MSSIGWEHPQDSSGQWDGFNDSGIEHFKGSPIPSLGREINQNSCDAIKDEGSPVRVSFKLLDIEVSKIPNLVELVENINYCNNEASDEGEKAQAFFQNALKLLSKKKIPVLCIEDRNTIGVKGPCNKGMPFHAFMKSSGQSVKLSNDAGGSYGIGKNAPFAVSDLRTIFVSTAFQNEKGEVEQLVQGKAILMSHTDSNGKVNRATGFWGTKSDCMPLSDAKNIPDWLLRPLDDETNKPCLGTSIFILGFNASDNWEERLSVSIAENFFGAILSGKLEVEISG